MLQVLLNHLVFDMPVQQAIEAPRFVTSSHPDSFEPHASAPGRLALEAGIDGATVDKLAGKGHVTEQLGALSTAVAGVCAISADLQDGLMCGGADPRRAARAMGW